MIESVNKIPESSKSVRDIALSNHQSSSGDRSNLRANIQKLNLTNTQRSQIREIMNSSRQEMSQILTDEQKQVLQERVQQR